MVLQTVLICRYGYERMRTFASIDTGVAASARPRG
jgi:hypothetical protein